MKLSNSGNLLGIALLVLLMILSVSYEAMGQGRGRRVSQLDKKCAKFVNCHDARDGRWDGRGPNRRMVFSDRILRRSRRTREFEVRNRIRRNRDRDFDRGPLRRRRR